MQEGLSMLLSDDDKARIKAEEIYRSSVVGSLETSRRGKRFVKAINSPLAIWFLGSVVLAAITSFYAWLVEDYEADRELSRIDMEIEFRLQTVESYVTESPGNSELLENAFRLVRGVEIETRAGSLPVPGLYPAWSGTSLAGLIAERSRLAEDDRNVIRIALALQAWCANTREGPPKSPKDAEAVKKSFRTAIGDRGS